MRRVCGFNARNVTNGESQYAKLLIKFCGRNLEQNKHTHTYLRHFVKDSLVWETPQRVWPFWLADRPTAPCFEFRIAAARALSFSVVMTTLRLNTIERNFTFYKWRTKSCWRTRRRFGWSKLTATVCWRKRMKSAQTTTVQNWLVRARIRIQEKGPLKRSAFYKFRRTIKRRRS